MLDLATSLALLQTECGMHRDMIIAYASMAQCFVFLISTIDRVCI